MIIWIETRFFSWIKSVFQREELTEQDTKSGYLFSGLFALWMAGFSILAKEHMALIFWLPLLLLSIAGFIVMSHKSKK